MATSFLFLFINYNILYNFGYFFVLERKIVKNVKRKLYKFTITTKGVLTFYCTTYIIFVVKNTIFCANYKKWKNKRLRNVVAAVRGEIYFGREALKNVGP